MGARGKKNPPSTASIKAQIPQGEAGALLRVVLPLSLPATVLYAESRQNLQGMHVQLPPARSSAVEFAVVFFCLPPYNASSPPSRNTLYLLSARVPRLWRCRRQRPTWLAVSRPACTTSRSEGPPGLPGAARGAAASAQGPGTLSGSSACSSDVRCWRSVACLMRAFGARLFGGLLVVEHVFLSWEGDAYHRCTVAVGVDLKCPRKAAA